MPVKSRNADTTLRGIGCVLALGTLALIELAAGGPTHANFRAVQPSVSVIGLEVKDTQDQTLGRVKDLKTYSNTQVTANHGVNTRQNLQDGTANAYTPLAQGTSFADRSMTRRIYAAMRADASLSHNAQNVEVGTFNSRITLRGRVNTEEGKRVIGEIAAMTGRPENISNLLEVRPVPVTTNNIAP